MSHLKPSTHNSPFKIFFSKCGEILCSRLCNYLTAFCTLASIHGNQNTHYLIISSIIPFRDIFDRESTDGTSRDGIVWRCENSIDKMSINKARGGLDFIKVKWVIARNRAIESGLEKWGPIVPEFVRTSLVRFANSSHSRIDGLQMGKGKNFWVGIYFKHHQ